MMPVLSMTQTMYPDCIRKEQTVSKKREVMFRTTGFENTVEVMIMVSITHFNGRL